jgi:hypothetical protein
MLTPVRTTTVCRDTSNRRGNYNSWDPRKTHGSKNISHSRNIATAEAGGLLLDTSFSRDFRIRCLKSRVVACTKVKICMLLIHQHRIVADCTESEKSRGSGSLLKYKEKLEYWI